MPGGHCLKCVCVGAAVACDSLGSFLQLQASQAPRLLNGTQPHFAVPAVPAPHPFSAPPPQSNCSPPFTLSPRSVNGTIMSQGKLGGLPWALCSPKLALPWNPSSPPWEADPWAFQLLPEVLPSSISGAPLSILGALQKLPGEEQS